MSHDQESAGSKNREREMFLAHLPPDTPVYCDHDYRDLETLPTPDSIGDSFVVVTDIAAELFDELDEQLPGLADYSPSLQLLIVKMRSLPHEEAAARLGAAIMQLASQMKLERRISLCGATRVDGPDRQKQADRSYKPARQRREWPTVAVEIDYSESRAKLEKDSIWWINASQGQVRQTITLDIKQGTGNIEIISRVPALSILPRQLAVSSRGRRIFTRPIGHLPIPRINHRITIKRGQGGANSTITGGDLTIPFATMLLDQPGEGEGDLVITADALLHRVAGPIWDAIDDAEVIRGKKKARKH
ncbi:uncharacterized protein TRUGW13939_06513 [Talaromyces rugulosus]|uniref:Uncharacterized protein n=1 Tax=Talaromyces rugulosus TaxID=121627 RepID=A0A7H8QZ53_TALRU|nr:uncharacterized protein TRUGW13939_06513 [Talaromyces rugulosus]QKX59379.1 hypothetical protein TRUGW13939_06513 [Talaromyces rugulosus]